MKALVSDDTWTLATSNDTALPDISNKCAIFGLFFGLFMAKSSTYFAILLPRFGIKCGPAISAISQI